MKERAVDRTVWRIRVGIGYGAVVLVLVHPWHAPYRSTVEPRNETLSNLIKTAHPARKESGNLPSFCHDALGHVLRRLNCSLQMTSYGSPFSSNSSQQMSPYCTV